MKFFELLAWKKTDWDFVGRRRYAFAFSGLLVLVGLVAAVQIGRGKAKLGIDFAGGLIARVVIEPEIGLDELRGALEERQVTSAILQRVEGQPKQTLLIRMVGEDADRAAAAISTSEYKATHGEAVQRIIRAAAPKAEVTVEGVQYVGAVVGGQLRRQAAGAGIAAILLIMLYIWSRFEYRFGVVAAIATAHDVLAVLGIMWLVGAEFNLLIVTALLTLAGYSLTDTVVIYDRIRENRRLHPGDSLVENINRSINEVLSRTIITTFTVMLPLAALVGWGSSVTYEFSLALLIGLFVGSYSTWFVASPIIVEWDAYRRRQAMNAAAQRFGGSARK